LLRVFTTGILTLSQYIFTICVVSIVIVHIACKEKSSYEEAIMEDQDKHKPNAPCVQGRMAKFMEPCLLLLLRGQRSHGYELMERLNYYGFEGTSSDMATLYRTLRQLEDDGMVSSEWEEGSQGPPKRVYELTEDGIILLENWASVLKENKDRLGRFLKTYKSLSANTC
jgi:PadR family transcriptional regulator PadR